MFFLEQSSHEAIQKFEEVSNLDVIVVQWTNGICGIVKARQHAKWRRFKTYSMTYRYSKCIANCVAKAVVDL